MIGIADEHEPHDAPLLFAISAWLRRVIVALAQFAQPRAAVPIDHFLPVGRDVFGPVLRAELQRHRAELHDALDVLRMIERIQHDHEAEVRVADEMSFIDAEVPADGFEIGNVRLQRDLCEILDARRAAAIAHVIGDHRVTLGEPAEVLECEQARGQDHRLRAASYLDVIKLDAFFGRDEALGRLRSGGSDCSCG